MTQTTKMHRYIWAWLGVVAAFAATFPIAMLRVSQTENFVDQPLNSWTCAGQEADQRQVVTFSQCAAMKVKPVSAASPQTPATKPLK